MGEFVLAFVDAQPLHVRLANGVGVLQRGDPGEVGGQCRHQQFDLHPADPRHLVVLFDDALLEHRHGVGHGGTLVGEVSLQAADERRVLLEDAPVFGRERGGDPGQILVDLVEHAPHALAVFHAPVELGKHLVRVVDRGDGLVGPRVDHPRPGVGLVGHEDAELERAKAGLRGRERLEMVADLLVDRDPARPAGRRVAASLDVAGEQLDTREQAAHAAHVAVAVPQHVVVDALECEEAVLEGGEWPEDRREIAIGEATRLGRPEVLLHDAIGAEHDHEPLPRGRRRGGEAREVAQEGQHRGANAEPPQQGAARDHAGHDHGERSGAGREATSCRGGIAATTMISTSSRRISNPDAANDRRRPSSVSPPQARTGCFTRA